MDNYLLLDSGNYSEDMPVIERRSMRGVIFLDGKLLVVETGNGEIKLPGGGMEGNETEIETLVREVLEETGRRVRPETVRLFYTIEEKRASFKEHALWHQISKIFLCDVDDSISEPKYTPGEIRKNMHVALMPIEEAIEKSKKIISGTDYMPWNNREYRTLLLIKEGRDRGMAESEEHNNEVQTWNEVTLVYNSALKEINTRLEILNDELQSVHQYNPIEHIKSRIKTPESIVKKLKKYGKESTIENMVLYVNDIAGIRVICSFTNDIYKIAEMLSNQSDIKVIEVRDYIKNPKASGYKSYHMLVTIPIFLSDKIVHTKVEIQIRTVAMDFWASLEHKINYKFEGNVPEDIREELVACAQMVSRLDDRMLLLNQEVQSLGYSEG